MKRRKTKKRGLQAAAVLQHRMEYYSRLAREEIAKGELGDREKIDLYLTRAQQPAEALLPYQEARLTPTEATLEGGVRKGVIRAPSSSKSLDEWQKTYCDPAELAAQEKTTQEMVKQLRETGKLN